MNFKFRIIWAAVVIFAIPLLIYLIYPEDWRQTLPWIGFAGGLYIVYEVIVRSKRNK